MAGVLDLIDDIDLGFPQRRRPRHVRERVNPLDIYDDVDLVSRFRFRRNDIEIILRDIQDEIQHETDRNAALAPSLQLLIALRFYASGSFQNVIGDGFHVSPSTVC